MKEKALERHEQLAHNTTGYSFECYLKDISGKVPSSEQMKLYQNDEIDKLTSILDYNFFCEELQRQIVKDNDLYLTKLFLKKWNFALSLHKLLSSNATSDEMFALIISKTKFCEFYEIEFAKKAPQKRVLAYIAQHKLCKKAAAICQSVRKITA